MTKYLVKTKFSSLILLFRMHGTPNVSVVVYAMNYSRILSISTTKEIIIVEDTSLRSNIQDVPVVMK